MSKQSPTQSDDPPFSAEASVGPDRWLPWLVWRGSRLGRHVIRTSARIEQAASQPNASEAIAEALRDGVAEVLQPSALEVALYDARSERYTLIDPAGAPVGTADTGSWLAQQPTAQLIRLAGGNVSAPVLAGARRRGAEVLVPLGSAGWIGLGHPRQRATYSRQQLDALHRLSVTAAAALEQASLLEAQRQRTEELQVLYWIAQAANFSTEIDDMMELIYTQLKRVMRLPSFYIALHSADMDTLARTFHIEDDERQPAGETWPASEGLPGIVLKNATTIRTDSYAAECERLGVRPAESGAIQAWMGTALTAEDKSIGVMVVSTRDPDLHFTQAEESVFVTVAAYTAATLERRGLYARLESRARELTTLYEIGNLLASSLDLDEVLDLVVRQAAELLDSEAGSLLLLDEGSGDLIFRISSGPAGARLIGSRIPANKGIAGAAFTENRPVISSDSQQDSRWFADFDSRADFTTRSLIAVPLNARGKTIGVLEVVNRQGPQPFTSQDSELLLSFAAQAAIAIENARLFTMTDQALQSRVEELTTIQVIDRQLNATLDYDAVMTQTLDWALRITGASTGAVAALQQEDGGARALRFLAQRGYDEAPPPGGAPADGASLDSTASALPSGLAPGSLWPLGRGLIGRTVAAGTTTLVTDVAHDPYYVAIKPGMRAQLTVPIRREARVIGAIALESPAASGFTPERVAAVERLANHAAIAIDNARLFEQVQNANDAKTEFISFVSHELRQPMTSIKGYADLLNKGVGGPLTEQQALFVDVIRNNVNRMDRMVQDLLDISRIESGKLRLEIEPVAPAEIIYEATQAFEQALTAKHQELHIDVSPDLPPVMGDRGRLIQVLTNLLSNANKYTPEGGHIAVRAELASTEGKPAVSWQVSDDGIGMTQDEVAQLFTKYFRSKSDTVRNVQGTGLGLVITRSIIELHGGHIHVESEHGGGATFSFTLPLRA